MNEAQMCMFDLALAKKIITKLVKRHEVCVRLYTYLHPHQWVVTFPNNAQMGYYYLDMSRREEDAMLAANDFALVCYPPAFAHRYADNETMAYYYDDIGNMDPDEVFLIPNNFGKRG